MLEEPDELTLQRLDGWAQAVATGLGSARDKHEGIQYKRARRVTRIETDAMYGRNALVARICDLKVNTALRKGWTFASDSWEGRGEEFKDRLEAEMGLTECTRETIKLGNRYGFAATMIPTDAKPALPLAMQRVTKLFPCFTLAGGTASEIMPLSADSNMGSATFRKVLMYQVTPQITGETIEMHRSHILAHEPIPMPYGSHENTDGMGVGPSVIDRLFEPLSRYGAAHGSAQSLLYVASIMFLGLDGWAEDYRKPGGPEALQKKLALMSESLSSNGVLGLDIKDKLGTAQHSTAGAFELVDRMTSFLGAHVDMPREIFFNESPTGMRGGEQSGAQAIWYGACQDERTSRIEPLLKPAIEVAARLWGYSGKCEFDWPALWTETEGELATRYKSNCEADRIMFEIGSASSEEIREDRLIRGNTGPLKVQAAEIDPMDTTSEDVELPTEPFDPAPLNATPAPSEEALNGAQISSLVSIVEKVAANLLPRDAAAGIISISFPAQAHRVQEILGSAGAVTNVDPGAVEAEADGTDEGPSDDPMPDDLMSKQEAAARFRVPTRTISLMIETGEIRYWGLRTHARVSLAELRTASKAHEGVNDMQGDKQ